MLNRIGNYYTKPAGCLSQTKKAGFGNNSVNNTPEKEFTNILFRNLNISGLNIDTETQLKIFGQLKNTALEAEERSIKALNTKSLADACNDKINLLIPDDTDIY